MTAGARPDRLTLEEFLAWEEGREGKHEFVDGRIYAMAGPSKIHRWIAHNIMHALHGQLATCGCRTFIEAEVKAGEDVFCADVLVTCGVDTIEGRLYEQPVLIVEVLSPSTEKYDRGVKRERYQAQLPSLQTYVLVAQDGILVEVLRRTGQGWTSQVFARMDAVIELSSPSSRLTVAQIYGGLLDRIGEGPVPGSPIDR